MVCASNPCTQLPNKSHDPKCAGRDVHVEIEPQLIYSSTITVLARRLYINEGKILGTVAKFKTKTDMQRAAAIWEVSNHIKASIW